MKIKITLLILVLTLITSIPALAWRNGEMEVKIRLNNSAEFAKLQSLKLDGDVYPAGYALMYVIPPELKKIRSANLKYEILKKDLNKYYENFWLQDVPPGYYTFDEIVDLADSLAANFPEICQKFIFGESVQGRELGALKITDNPQVDESNEAEVMFDGGIHGDEVGASENVIRFARHLCLEYDSDPEITELINNREIWLYYCVNPDARAMMSRRNANNVDLNRDWGYMWDGWGSSPGAYSQPESKALRSCMYNRQFVVHTTYHSGTEFISCPWSYRPDHCPDYDQIIQLAGVYSSTSTYANLDYGQGCTGMYAINGSSKDTNYGVMGSISWSMEISYDKQPPASQIMMYYNRNVPAMLAIIEHAGFGVEGTVTDSVSGEPVSAAVFVDDYFPTYTDKNAGDYHKYVLPGTYSITIKANGYQTKTIENIIVSANSSTVTNFQLQPEDGQFVYKISSSQIPENNYSDEGDTPGVIGAPDNRNYSIGKNGWVVLDMQFPISDGPGNDLIVYEGDASPEGYECYAGETIDGPWNLLGAGEGTTEFDLAMGSIIEAQFIKIEDDGDGPQTAADAGFDLDGIASLENSSGVYIGMMGYEVDDSGGNNNGRIDPGEEANILATLRNNGDAIANSLNGLMSTTSSHLEIVAASFDFGNLEPQQTCEGTFTVHADESTPTGENVLVDLNISANSGSYTNAFELEFCIGSIPALIVDFTPDQASGSIMEEIFNNLDVTCEYQNSLPEDLDLYAATFVCLGIYSDNYVLSTNEGQALADYLDTGGNLYMEGGDTWYYDDPTVVHAMFNINGLSDGSGDLGTILGESSTFTENMTFNYSGNNSWIDHLEPNGDAFTIFSNQSPNYVCGVANNASDYKTIGSSFEFGGLDDGTSTKEELMVEFLEFFSPDIQTGILEGYVTGSDSGEPIEGADIGDLTTTNADGFYSVEMQVGIYSITCSAAGYGSVTIDEIEISTDQTTEQDFELDYLTPPTNLEAEVNGNDVTLEWNTPVMNNFNLEKSKNMVEKIGYPDPVRSLTGFKIFRDDEEIAELNDPTATTYTDYDLAGNEHTYYLIAIYDNGYSDPSNSVTVILIATNLNELPNKTQIISNTPNPFSNITKINFSIKKSTSVKISIYNIIGQKITTIVNSHFDPGFYQVDWNGKNSSETQCANGIYFFIMETTNSKSVKKILIYL